MGQGRLWGMFSKSGRGSKDEPEPKPEIQSRAQGSRCRFQVCASTVVSSNNNECNRTQHLARSILVC